MSVTFNPRVNMGVREILEASVDAASAKTLVHSGFDFSAALTASTTPPVTKTAFKTQTLSGGALTIDLTALIGVNNLSQDCSGLKLQGIIVSNPLGNASLNMAPGASNPYPIFGTANDVDIPAGSTLFFYCADTLPDVSGTVKTIDFAGTGTETFSLGVVLG